jgi:serine/threonine-protein kinase
MLSTGFQDVAISPDGRRVAYRAGGDGGARLYTRALDGTGGRFLPGGDLSSPFFSFDGAEVGFYAFGTRSLMRASALGGPPSHVADSLTFLAGASWSADDRITFATTDPTTGIMRVAASGGATEALTQPGNGENHVLPEVLPGGRAVLFTVLPAAGAGTSPHLAVLDLASGGVQRLIPGSHPRFASGHLVYLIGNDLMAVPFDEQRLRVTQSPVVVLEGVEATRGAGQFSLSREGTLLVAMDAGTRRRELVWVDRNGREEPFPAVARAYTYPRISPDGRRIALNTRDSGRGRIFIWDSAREAATPLESASGASLDLYPVWHRDADHLAYVSGANPRHQLRMTAVGSGGPGEPIAGGFALRAPYFFSVSGNELVYAWQGAHGEPREIALWKTSIARDAEPVRLLRGARNADLSPDGRFIVYQGDETGRFEIYVRSFPDIDEQYLKVSTDGGVQPVWSPRNGELFYVEPGSPSHLLSVRVDSSPTLVVSRPRRLCEWPYYRGEFGRTYDVSRPDGDRFLAIRMAADTARAAPEPRVEVVLDWPTLLGAGRPR